MQLQPSVGTRMWCSCYFSLLRSEILRDIFIQCTFMWYGKITDWNVWRAAKWIIRFCWKSAFEISVIVLNRWLDDRVISDFTSFSIVSQSCQEDGWVIMKDCVQWNPVYDLKIPASSGAWPRDRKSGRPALNPLSYWSILLFLTNHVCVSFARWKGSLWQAGIKGNEPSVIRREIWNQL